MLSAGDNPTLWERRDLYSGSHPIDSEASYKHRHRVRAAGARSLAHTGGVLIGYVLSTRCLGVMPKQPGFSACVVHPHPGNLAWAQGVFPTPHGGLGVRWEKKEGELSMHVSVPLGIEADLVLDCKPDTDAVTHNGKLLDPRGAATDANVTVRRNCVSIRVQGGSHELVVRAAG